MLLQELSDARGVSGDEKEVRDVICKAVSGLVDETRVDALGNLICLKKARGKASDGAPRKVMVAAHMDEIGLIITGINSDGTLRFAKVGGIDDRVLLSKQVMIGEKQVPGVIGYRPIHLLSREARAKAADLSKAVIDIGATTKAAAEGQVEPGDYATFRSRFEVLSSDGLRTVKGKAFDDRAGCAVLVQALGEDYAFDLYAVFTAQEEVGLRGSQVAAYAIAPDVGLALEGTICDDIPKKTDTSPVTRVGDGPAISFMDRTTIANRKLLDLLVATAKRLEIPFQFKGAVAGGTDAGAISRAREGAPATTISVPSRYIHAPVCLLSLRDLDYTVQLVKAALHALEGGLEL